MELSNYHFFYLKLETSLDGLSVNASKYIEMLRSIIKFLETGKFQREHVCRQQQTHQTTQIPQNIKYKQASILFCWLTCPNMGKLIRAGIMYARK